MAATNICLRQGRIRNGAYLSIGVTSGIGAEPNGAPGGGLQGYRGEAMHYLGYELRRISIPRTPVNKGKKEGRAS